MTERLHIFVEEMKEKNAAWVTDVTDADGEVTVVVPKEHIVDACVFVR